jgi:hypothetical protein
MIGVVHGAEYFFHHLLLQRSNPSVAADERAKRFISSTVALLRDQTRRRSDGAALEIAPT